MLRLAIAAARFWPLVEDRQTHLLQLAESLLAAGHQVTVVTPLWKRSWPQKMMVGPVPLVPSRDTASVITAAADSPAITRPGHRRCGTTTVVGTATRCGSGSSLRDVKASTRGSGSSPT